MNFILHQRLAIDTIHLSHLHLCQVLLRNDSTYPWLILVPQRFEVGEIHELSATDRSQLMEEITNISKTMQTLFKPDKLNIGALGNIVPQLHIHIIARYQRDPAWPDPVWGATPPLPYSDEQIKHLKQILLPHL